MGRSRKIVLETRTFEKVGLAAAFFSEMLNKYSIGETVSNTDALDLTALLHRHDERTKKIGVGISHFEVGLPPDYPGKCFWLVRSNGTREDFSIKHCLALKTYD